jgi:predicted GH43/DUF377 family glycosyl hydrolase
VAKNSLVRWNFMRKNPVGAKHLHIGNALCQMLNKANASPLQFIAHENYQKTRFSVILAVYMLVVLFCNASLAQNEWDKHYANPILKTGIDGSWDDGSISNPSVLFKDNEYKMWYTGFDGEQMRIGYTTSIDGENWVKHPSNPILDLGVANTWDSVHVANPSVLFDGITYKMWYTGSDGKNTRIGYASSSDGIHWVKYSDNPVLDLGAWGINGDSDVWSPSVLFDGTEYKMWYTSFDGNIRIGYAHSVDGLHWIKNTDSPALNVGPWGAWDDRGAWSPSVLFDGSEYSMWYTGWNGISTGIGYAKSKDGINWMKPSKYPALDLGTTGSWDYYYVNNPSVLLINNKFRMWYSGCSSNEVYMIGYAIGATRPDIDISERFHDFDDVPIGKTDNWDFVVSNRGNDNLLITSFTSDNPVFTLISSNFSNEMKPVSDYIFPAPYSIPPNGSMKFTVQFTRGAEKTYKGSIVISSNDRDESKAFVQLWMGNKLRYVRQIPNNFASFDNNLSPYMKGSEVKYLQVILAEEGPEVYPESKIDSCYDEFTKDAVISFQKRHKIDDTIGFVGLETRKKLTEILNKHRSETYDRVDVVHDAVINNYKDFLPDNFPSELILAITSQETGLFFNFNNELIEAKENGNKNNVGRGIMQITSSDFVGAGNKADDYLVYRCKNLLDKEAIYTYYSNTPQGVEANIRDGLYALKTKYNLANNCKGNRDLGITDEEMRWISTIQRYNTYSKFLFNVDANSDFSNDLNKCSIPEKLKNAFEGAIDCNLPSSSAIITMEEQSKKWKIIDNELIYIVRKENDTATVSRTGAPTLYIKNLADKLRRLKSAIFFPRLKKDQCEDLADKLEKVYNNSETITLGCPAELKIYDSTGRITGSLVGSPEKSISQKLNGNSDTNSIEEIPNSIYDKDNKTIVVFLPSDSYRYVVTGTNDGDYELNITSNKDGKTNAFNAIGIPISANAVHQWTVDWKAISQGKKGVTLQIDSNGDGDFEETIITDNLFIFDRLDPQL